jgi:hypothetical protein
MEIPSWSIAAWPIVEWYLPANCWTFPRLLHGQTRLLGDPTEPERRGDTVWTGELDGERIGFAWDWVEIRPRAIVVADPNMVLSNVRFLGDEGDSYLEVAPSIVQLNRLVHALPWQECVLEAIGDSPAAAVPGLLGQYRRAKSTPATISAMTV